MAQTLHLATRLHLFRWEGYAAQERMDAALRHATDQEIPFWIACGTVLQGWVRALHGSAEAGIAQMQQGKHHEARQPLTAISAWFTEGFDTVDLQEGKVPLEAWS